MGEAFRLKDQCFRLGIASTAVFGAMFVATIVSVQPGMLLSRQRLAVLVFGVVWLCLLSLGIWLIAAYLRVRVTFYKDVVECQGVVRHRAVRFDEITQARWRRRSLKLSTEKGDMSVWFDDFVPEDRRRIIQLFRESVGQGVQKGWERHGQLLLDETLMEAHWCNFAAVCKRACVTALLLGPQLGVICGLFVYFLSPLRTTALGYVIVDWWFKGLIVSLGSIAFLLGVRWIAGSESE